MQPHTGVIDIRSLLQLARARLNPRLYASAIKNSGLSESYLRRWRLATTSLPVDRGIYLWGRYDKRDRWTNVYVGSAESLSARIRDRLRLVRFHIADPKRSDNDDRPGIKGPGEPTRNQLSQMSQCNRIFWVATPELARTHRRDVENDVIEILNPTANRLRQSPLPYAQDASSRIVKALHAEIHRSRAKGYSWRNA
jgi:hypothetical protein